jgi:hypothetical protein
MLKEYLERHKEIPRSETLEFQEFINESIKAFDGVSCHLRFGIP